MQVKDQVNQWRDARKPKRGVWANLWAAIFSKPKGVCNWFFLCVHSTYRWTYSLNMSKIWGGHLTPSGSFGMEWPFYISLKISNETGSLILTFRVRFWFTFGWKCPNLRVVGIQVFALRGTLTQWIPSRSSLVMNYSWWVKTAPVVVQSCWQLSLTSTAQRFVCRR